MTKSDVIRDLLQENPAGMPKALAKVASKKLGTRVKPGDISNYKSQMKRAGQLNGVAPVPEKAVACATFGRGHRCSPTNDRHQNG